MLSAYTVAVATTLAVAEVSATQAAALLRLPRGANSSSAGSGASEWPAACEAIPALLSLRLITGGGDFRVLCVSGSVVGAADDGVAGGGGALSGTGGGGGDECTWQWLVAFFSGLFLGLLLLLLHRWCDNGGWEGSPCCFSAAAASSGGTRRKVKPSSGEATRRSIPWLRPSITRAQPAASHAAAPSTAIERARAARSAAARRLPAAIRRLSSTRRGHPPAPVDQDQYTCPADVPIDLDARRVGMPSAMSTVSTDEIQSGYKECDEPSIPPPPPEPPKAAQRQPQQIILTRNPGY